MNRPDMKKSVYWPWNPTRAEATFALIAFVLLAWLAGYGMAGGFLK